MKITSWTCLLISELKFIFHWCTHLVVLFKLLLSSGAEVDSIVGGKKQFIGDHVMRGCLKAHGMQWYSLGCTEAWGILAWDYEEDAWLGVSIVWQGCLVDVYVYSRVLSRNFKLLIFFYCFFNFKDSSLIFVETDS